MTAPKSAAGTIRWTIESIQVHRARGKRASIPDRQAGCFSVVINNGPARSPHVEVVEGRERGRDRNPAAAPSQIRRRAHEVALDELDPAMAQDVVGGGAVEIEVRQYVAE